METDFVFGVSYSGTLSFNIGDPISSIEATNCAILSDLTTFLTVTKENCGQTFECFNTNTATTNWVSSVTICPDDGEADIVPFLNNAFLDPGDNFAYLLTDENLNLIEVIFSSSYDFEGSGSSTNRIYAVSYDGNLDFELGAPISEITATNCATLSDQELFLTINKGGCTSSLFSVRGSVRSPAGQPIHGAEIINERGQVLAVSESDGTYTIPDLEAGSSLRLTARPTTPVLGNGISSSDLVLVTRHILGLNSFTDPYQIIAADANNNVTVSATDLVEMRRVILELSTSFTNNSDWRFVISDQNIEANIITGQILEMIAVDDIRADTRGLDFIGVKIGDVNGNASLDLR